MNYSEVMKRLESLASHDPADLAGMARFGINVDKAWVISIPKLRNLAKEIKRSVISTEMEKSAPGKAGRSLGYARDDNGGAKKLHNLALQVWASGVHEARILAGFIDDSSEVTEKQMESWVSEFDSWDVTDMICGNLFDRTEFAVKKAIEWSAREEEFVKRAGFVLMAGLAVHDKTMSDAQFVQFLEIIKRESGDKRNFVRKAINWALRAIGKSRNKYLYLQAKVMAQEILDSIGNSKDESARAARFIAGDALRELEKEYIQKRFC